MSENVNGDKKYWFQDLKGAEIDEDGKPIAGSSEAEKWFNIYLAPYLNNIEKEILPDGSYIVYLADGGALRLPRANTRDYYFFPGKPKKCIKKSKNNAGDWQNISGICMFAFNFKPNDSDFKWKYHYNKGMEPFKHDWNGDINKLKSGSVYSCQGNNSSKNNLYCTALIQMNDWKIPDDYPFKVSY